MSHMISTAACGSFWACWFHVSVFQSPLSPPPVCSPLLASILPPPPVCSPSVCLSVSPPTVCLPPHPISSTPLQADCWTAPRRTKPGRGLPAHGCCLDRHRFHRCSRGTEVSVRCWRIRVLMKTLFLCRGARGSNPGS